jgi:carboxymethylenebutenolidase
MPRHDVNVPTPDGECPSIVITPDGDGPWPAVILFMDAGGVRAAMVTMAERLAAMGYVAFLPEMYYRSGPYEPFDMATLFADAEERQRLFGMITSLTTDNVVSDAGAFLDYLSTLPDVAGTVADTKVGTTGYCMGGRLSLVSAANHPDRIAAAASFHGGHLVTDAPDSPHRLVERITGRVYVAGAENDASFTTDDAAALDDALTAAGVEHTVEIYPAGHGFAVPDNATFDAATAERHWQALDDLYAATLTV